MTGYLTDQQLAILELASNSGFEEVFMECLEAEELVENFERIYGVKRPPQRLTPIERMVDESTGFRQSQWSEFLSEFVPFVYRFVWLTWPDRNNPEWWK